jgi:hypothetical protein
METETTTLGGCARTGVDVCRVLGWYLGGRIADGRMGSARD